MTSYADDMVTVSLDIRTEICTGDHTPTESGTVTAYTGQFNVRIWHKLLETTIIILATYYYYSMIIYTVFQQEREHVCFLNKIENHCWFLIQFHTLVEHPICDEWSKFDNIWSNGLRIIRI